MHLDVIGQEGHIKGVILENGVKIHPALGIDGDTFLFADDIKIVEDKINLLKRSLEMLGEGLSSLKVIPLYKKLSVNDCMSVIEIAKNYTGSNFVKELSEVFYTDRIHDWVKEQINKKVI